MGACLRPSNGPDDPNLPPYRPLYFHPYVKGSQIVMNKSCCIAGRAASFHDGIVFSNRPVELYEKVTLKILKEDIKWHGGLRVGFTWEDPSLIDPNNLPPFTCPDLVSKGKCRARVLPDECGAEGTVVSFWVDRRGNVFCSINQESEGSLLLEGISVRTPLWAVMDLYGRTKAVQLLDLSSLPPNPNELSLLQLKFDTQSESTCGDFHKLLEEYPGNPCVICFGHKANTMMLPCTHADFCSCCALKILNTSSCCPLCRREVKRIFHITLFAERNPRIPAGKAKDIQPPP